MPETKTPKTAYLGTGRRKTSVARVRLTEGSGRLLINGRALEDYFNEDEHRNAVVGPLLLTEMANRLDVTILVHGGGITGQAGACSQGVARALKQMFGLTAPAEQAAPTTDGTPDPTTTTKPPKTSKTPKPDPTTEPSSSSSSGSSSNGTASGGPSSGSGTTSP